MKLQRLEPLMSDRISRKMTERMGSCPHTISPIHKHLQGIPSLPPKNIQLLVARPQVPDTRPQSYRSACLSHAD